MRQAELTARELSAAQEAKVTAAQCCTSASSSLEQKQAQLNKAHAASSTASECAQKLVAIAKYTKMGIDAQMEALKHASMALVRVCTES
jgi:hypothetical protein